MKNSIMLSWVGAAAVLMGLSHADAANVTTNGTEVTVDVSTEGETYLYPVPLTSETTELVKTGAGTLNLGVTTNTFSGIIRVNAGILSGDYGVGTSGSFGSPSEVHIAEGRAGSSSIRGLQLGWPRTKGTTERQAVNPARQSTTRRCLCEVRDPTATAPSTMTPS